MRKALANAAQAKALALHSAPDRSEVSDDAAAQRVAIHESRHAVVTVLLANRSNARRQRLRVNRVLDTALPCPGVHKPRDCDGGEHDKCWLCWHAEPHFAEAHQGADSDDQWACQERPERNAAAM